MKLDLLTGLYIFMMAAFIGFEVIRRHHPRRRGKKHVGNNFGNGRHCCGDQ